jgi:pimeloyl-ACP methyl ester carboxylesterase
LLHFSDEAQERAERADVVSDQLPIVLVPGLNCSARLYGEQIPALWRFGPVTVADHTRDDSMTAIAARILAAAPPCFALVGLSMGGYVAMEMTRQAPQRVGKLALLDTAARAETPEQTEARGRVIELAKTGRFADVPELQFSSIRASQPAWRRGAEKAGSRHGRGDRGGGVFAPGAGDQRPP